MPVRQGSARGRFCVAFMPLAFWPEVDTLFPDDGMAGHVRIKSGSGICHVIFGVSTGRIYTGDGQIAGRFCVTEFAESETALSMIGMRARGRCEKGNIRKWKRAGRRRSVRFFCGHVGRGLFGIVYRRLIFRLVDDALLPSPLSHADKYRKAHGVPGSIGFGSRSRNVTAVPPAEVPEQAASSPRSA